MKDILIQIVGVVAMVLTITSPLHKKRSLILASQYTGNLVWCVHYFLLGAFTGVYMNFQNVLRGIVFSINKKWAKSVAWVYIFCIMSIAMGIHSFDKWFCILPIIGTLIATCALYIKQENTLRKVYLISIPFWIVYNILAHSIAGAISSSFTLVSFIVSIIRYDKLEKQAKLNDTQPLSEASVTLSEAKNDTLQK